MIFICPLPMQWKKVYEHLFDRWRADGEKTTPPPIPLILNGWVYSNDMEKLRRWKETISWAERNGCSSLIPVFKAEEKYIVEEVSNYEIGPMGGPMYLPWDYTKKGKYNKETIQVMLKRLKDNWTDIVGSDLSSITVPVGFTGKKNRRLLVKADKLHKPPWGDWKKLDLGGNRRTFTQMRVSINKAISSLEVDHIDFDTSD